MSEELYTQHLVKLMAKENLTLTFSPSVDTAAMNLKDRTILVNSYLNRFTGNVLAFERLLCHEVGHALYSSTEEWLSKTSKFDKELVNVFEDIRIENLLKLKFPGLRKLFSTGFYALDTLLDTEFGMSAVEQLTADSHFLDRMNVYFKSNHSHPIGFSESEFAFIQKLKNFKNPEEMEPLLIEFLTNFSQQRDQKSTSSKRNTYQSSDPNSDIGSRSETSDEPVENQEWGREENQERSNADGEMDFSQNNSITELQSELKNTLSYREAELFKKLKTKSDDLDYDVVEIQQLKPNIIANADITKFIRDRIPETSSIEFEFLGTQINKMLSDSEKASQLLYTEFERQKNAKDFRQQQRVKTGELNLSRLSQYKTSSSLFKNLTIKPNQKNHEVIVFLDWSTSIRSNLIDLIKESITIVKFCKKANIPCSVYSFINNHSIKHIAKSITGVEVEEGDWLVEMLNTKSETLVSDCTNLFLLGYIITGGYYLPLNYLTRSDRSRIELNYLKLGRTPLEYALFNAPYLIKAKTEKNKRICLAIISDGESDPVRLYRKTRDTTNFPEKIFRHTPFIDPLSKSITMFSNKDQFLYSRLKQAFPTLSILTIHIADTASGAIHRNGFIDTSEGDVVNEISEKLSKSNVYFNHFDYYDHLIIKIKEVRPVSDTAVLTKAAVKALLKSNLHPMSKYIYKQVAACLA